MRWVRSPTGAPPFQAPYLAPRTLRGFFDQKVRRREQEAARIVRIAGRAGIV